MSDRAPGYVNKVSCCVRCLTGKSGKQRKIGGGTRGGLQPIQQVYGAMRKSPIILTDVKKTNWKQRYGQEDDVEMNSQCLKEVVQTDTKRDA